MRSSALLVLSTRDILSSAGILSIMSLEGPALGVFFLSCCTVPRRRRSILLPITGWTRPHALAACGLLRPVYSCIALHFAVKAESFIIFGFTVVTGGATRRR